MTGGPTDGPYRVRVLEKVVEAVSVGGTGRKRFSCGKAILFQHRKKHLKLGVMGESMEHLGMREATVIPEWETV